MIDELFKAATSIECAGISIKDWHPKFKPLPKVTAKAPCLRVWLDDTGHVSDLEPLAAEHAATLRKYEPDNGKSFPGFNVRPLYISNFGHSKEAKASEKKWVTDWKEKGADWGHTFNEMSDLWAKDTINTVERVLTTISADLKNRYSEQSDVTTLSKLFQVVEKMTATTFQAEYCEKLKEKVKNGELPHNLLVFFGQEGKEKFHFSLI